MTQSTGRGFNPGPFHYYMSTPNKLFHPCASVTVTKQYSLVFAKERQCSAAGKVTAGLADSNGSSCRIYDSHLRADCLVPGIGSDRNAHLENATTFYHFSEEALHCTKSSEREV